MSNVSRVNPEIAAQIAFRQSDRQIFSFERDHYYHEAIENAMTKFASIFKKISATPNRPDRLHAPGNAFFPGVVPGLGVSGTLEAAGGASSGLFNASLFPTLFRRFCLDNSAYLAHFNCRLGYGALYVVWHFFTKSAFPGR